MVAATPTTAAVTAAAFPVGQEVLWLTGTCYGVVVDTPAEWLDAGQLAVQLEHHGDGQAIGIYPCYLVAKPC